MTLSIPHDKVQDALQAVNRYITARSINKRQLQSLIGKLVHVAKCVEPVRVFISRLLEALRSFGDRWYIKVTEDMTRDLAWFLEFLVPWNGRSLIPKSQPTKSIQVDACLPGVGATDGHTAYAARVAPDDDPVANITELECANIIVALHTFITPQDAGGHILVQCDNLSSVHALTSGRAHNPILAECARASWMLQAKFAVKLSFSHIAGAYNQAADALSRAHTSSAHHDLAQEYIDIAHLLIVHPCTHILSELYPPILSRSGVELAGGPRGGETGTGPSTWHESSPQDNNSRAGELLPPVRNGPGLHVGSGCLSLDRIHSEQGHFPCHHKEQTVTYQSIRSPGRRVTGRPYPHTSHAGSGRSIPTQGFRVKKEGCHPGTNPTVGIGCTPRQRQRPHGKDGSSVDVLWRTAPIRGGSTYREKILSRDTPDTGGPSTGGETDSYHKSRKKSAAIQPAEGCYTIPHRRPSNMPGPGGPHRHTTDPRPPGLSTTSRVYKQTISYADLIPQGRMGSHNAPHWHRPHEILTT